MERGTMNEAAFEKILERQWPNDEKVAQSDYVIKTDTIDDAKQHVIEIVTKIRDSLNA
jgi:dephospho-CoA kinase